MNNDTNQAAHVTCPKCFGSGHLRHFAHVNNGDCYQCSATGSVVASSIQGGRGSAGVAYKTIETSMGPAHIARFGAGFSAQFDVGMAWFDIAGGVIALDAVSDTMVGREAEILRDLKAAHRPA